jgi:type II secretory pathway pseudopilin PulG
MGAWFTTNNEQLLASNLSNPVTFTKKPRRTQCRRKQRGYVLLTIMLMMALAAISFTAIAADQIFAAKRDREEEMIHRGVQYSRAIRRYVKKFGRYPTRIEELENTSDFRFLRKRYKDPITGKDFKLLHLGEVQLTFGAAIPGLQPAGANPAALNASNVQQVIQGAVRGLSGPSGPGTQATEGEDLAPAAEDPDTKNQNQTFGGGPIVGVASTSKDKTIRIFNKKEHYNEWQFIYDPASDRGGLLNTPAQPPLQQGQPGAPGGQPTSPASQPPQ